VVTRSSTSSTNDGFANFVVDERRAHSRTSDICAADS
jgi:hypothetical protein